VLEPLGADTTGSQFLEPDGTFPNHIPNPENKDAMAAAVDMVKSSGECVCTYSGGGGGLGLSGRGSGGGGALTLGKACLGEQGCHGCCCGHGQVIR
jgi:hypothetical protein